MNKEVKKILEKEFDYDFKSEFYTDEILLMIEEVIKATTLQLLQTDVVGQSEQLSCAHEWVKPIINAENKKCSKCGVWEEKAT